jgi:hypothetical protein
MPARKTSPKREINYEPAMKAGKYGAMGAFYLIVIAAIIACVFFIVYSAEAHGSTREGDIHLDPYEHDFGRMTISAYATIIALLGAILILMFYMTYLAHKHFHH